MRFQILVIAKAPVPGRVKTRLCPPCTPVQAAALAQAALLDTLAAASAIGTVRRILLLEGDFRAPPGWTTVAQRGVGLADRIANGMADTALDGPASLLIGMDTPQVTPPLLQRVVDRLSTSDAVLAPAQDGGWWALALRDAAHADALRTVPMSQQDTGRMTREALAGQGLSVGEADALRDVDTALDAVAVAAQCPQSRFAHAVAEQITSW